jgi:O-6-methylguanine DNA methyltransferase
MRSTEATPIGEMTLDAGEHGLVRCGTFGGSEPAGDDSAAARRHLEHARTALAEYFAGTRRDFADLELDAHGTPFQLAVWRELRAIAYGTSVSYGALAHRVGRPRSARAIGQANANNPLGIVQPCHRVVGADGSLVGFGFQGGVAHKRWLLEHERRVVGGA